jgi:hypothetical protein
MNLGREKKYLQANDPHHGVAGVDVDLKIDLPPPLPCMRWFATLCLSQSLLLLTSESDRIQIIGRWKARRMKCNRPKTVFITSDSVI